MGYITNTNLGVNSMQRKSLPLILYLPHLNNNQLQLHFFYKICLPPVNFSHYGVRGIANFRVFYIA